MKKKWMKMMALLLGVGGVMIGVGGCEEEDVNKRSDLPRSLIRAGYLYYYGEIWNSVEQKVNKPATGATIRFYANEADYVFDENFLETGTIDENGEYLFTSATQPGTYWFKIEKEEFNNLRYAKLNYFDINTIEEKVRYDGVCCGGSSDRVILSTTPTNLQLTIYHQGVPVPDATVQLFLSESAYLENLPAQADVAELEKSYGIPDDRLGDGALSDFIQVNREYFTATTDAEGVVLFENLEPRQYWFKVTKGELSNSAGTIMLEEALPDNAEITTSITVGIN